MKIYTSSLSFPTQNAPLHLAVGNFDGLHLGHQKLLQKVQAQRRFSGGLLGIYSFQPHPQVHFSPQTPHIYLEKRSTWHDRLRDFGVDILFEENFTKSFAQMSPEEFLKNHWSDINLRTLVVGEDFRFGQNRAGDVSTLKIWSEKNHVDLFPIGPVVVNGERVSTSRIKNYLQQGKPEVAQELLGRPFSVRGVVQPGEKKGRLLGFPTLNLIEESAKLLKKGVYLTQVRGALDVWPSITNVGVRPTLHQSSPIVIEAHIMGGFQENLYDQSVEVEFLTFVRPEKKFSSFEELKLQIAQDVQVGREKFKI